MNQKDIEIFHGIRKLFIFRRNEKSNYLSSSGKSSSKSARAQPSFPCFVIRIGELWLSYSCLSVPFVLEFYICWYQQHNHGQLAT